MAKFTNSDEYRKWVSAQDWYQTISLSDGIVTPGSVRTDKREALLSGLAVEGKRVLDIGCNSGQYCLWAKRHGAAEVIGIDLDEGRLAQAKTIAENEGHQIDYRALSLLDASRLGQFDLVFCFAVLTEIPDFSGAVRVLKKLLNGEGLLELDLARPLLLIPRLRALRQGRGWGELRQNKRGEWIFSPTLRTLRSVFGTEYVVSKRRGGIRYDTVHIKRKESGAN